MTSQFFAQFMRLRALTHDADNVIGGLDLHRIGGACIGAKCKAKISVTQYLCDSEDIYAAPERHGGESILKICGGKRTLWTVDCQHE